MSKAVTPPSVFVVCGITGDLASRKLLPALYQLFKRGLLDTHTKIIGTTRQQLTVDELLQTVEVCVLEEDNICDPMVIGKLKQALHILTLNPTQTEDFALLDATIKELEITTGPLQRLYYLSVPPTAYSTYIQHLPNTPGSRLLVEKPFGRDAASAQALIAETTTYFDESQVFRIDHYLAKETAQNILTFRQCNPVFYSLWNSAHIREIHVEAFEQIDIEGRANFYESTGALRDIVQSHLLQLLTLVTIKDPHAIDSSDELHAAKLAVLEKMSVDIDSVLRAQYQGYQDEVDNPDSHTETFTCVPLTIDTDQWRGTTFYVSTGKALHEKCTHIKISFTDPQSGEASNTLTFRVQPNEGISLTLQAKRPGFSAETQLVPMEFTYQSTFKDASFPDAYERVLVDALNGDRTLFASSDEVVASWNILDPVLKKWANQPTIAQYPKGSTADEAILSATSPAAA